MTRQFDNTNKGSYFPNTNKKTQNHPDFSGKINVGGVEYYLSGWSKVSKAGKKFHSLSVKPVNDVAHSPAPQRPAPQAPSLDQVLPDDDFDF